MAGYVTPVFPEIGVVRFGVVKIDTESDNQVYDLQKDVDYYDIKNVSKLEAHNAKLDRFKDKLAKYKDKND